MSAMYGFVLCVMLCADGPKTVIPVRSCNEAYAWLQRAEAWARRSDIPLESGPHLACYRVPSAPWGLAL
jgi:hypothetical protein